MSAPESTCGSLDRPAEAESGQSDRPEFLEQQHLAEVRVAADPRPALEKLARLYMDWERWAQAFQCLNRRLTLAQEAEEEARCRYMLGLVHEHFGDFPAAAAHYRRGLALEPTNPTVWYFLNNLLAYCLQAGGDFQQAEFYAHRAVEFEPRRGNAFKNLGLALKGQGRLAEAARAFIAGTRADPSDGRAACLLDNLLAEHPEMLPDFGSDLAECHRLVQGIHELITKRLRSNAT